jgi:hypothetical protein
MTESPRNQSPMIWINQNLWAIVSAMMAALASYVAGTTTADNRMTALEADLAALQVKVKNHDAAFVCHVRTLDKLTDKAGVSSPCALTWKE